MDCGPLTHLPQTHACWRASAYADSRALRVVVETPDTPRPASPLVLEMRLAFGLEDTVEMQRVGEKRAAAPAHDDRAAKCASHADPRVCVQC